MATLTIAGERVALRFSWGHIATLRDLLGAEFDAEIGKALSEIDLPRIAEILSVVTGLPASAIMSASPPIVATVRAIEEGLGEAFHGPTRKPKAEAGEAPGPFEKMTRTFPAALSALWRLGRKAAA